MEMKEFNERLKSAMADVAAMNREAREGTLDIHGRTYTQVAARIEIFRKHFGCEGRLRIVDIQQDDTHVWMHASCEIFVGYTHIEGDRACHVNEWQVVAEGIDREPLVSPNPKNKIPAFQNCETSAYGRALANLGLHGGEYASADEMVAALAVEGAQPITGEQKGTLERLIDDAGADEEKFLAYLGVTKLDDLLVSRFNEAVGLLEKKKHMKKES